MELWKLAAISVATLLCIIAVSLTTILTYRISTHASSTRRSVLILSLISACSATACMMGDTVHSSQALLSGSPALSAHFSVVMAVCDVLLWLGDMTFYSLLIVRVESAFADSVYALKRCFVWLLWAFTASCVALGVGYVAVLVRARSVLAVNKYFAVSTIAMELALDAVLSAPSLASCCR